jgi:hypothetical protein
VCVNVLRRGSVSVACFASKRAPSTTFGGLSQSVSQFEFTGSADTADSPPVAIVNETFARRLLGFRNPIGARVRQAQSGRPFVEREIVGVKDATYRDLREPVPPTIYIPYVQQEAPSIMSLSVRAASW